MSYTYTNITENYFKVLNLSSRNASNLRMSNLSPAFLQILSEYHNDNITDDNFMERMGYNSYLSTYKLQNLFPKLFDLQYTLKSTDFYLQHMRTKFEVPIDRNTFKQTYPIAVRYTNGTNLWLIERPPFQASITYRPSGSGYNIRNEGKSKEYNIWMPWTVMLINMDPKSSFYETFLFFNDGPIQSLDEKAIPCFFPNMYHDGRMCLNQTGIMLQQHLSETNTFDVNTVYNFILNDYMSGGWNLDLGIQNFDVLRNFGTQFKNAYRVITQGILGDKRYPSAVTGVYQRISAKKYIANFLNYFSLSPSEEILSVISQAKETINVLNSQAHHQRFTSYADIIKRINDQIDHSFNSFESKFQSPYLDHHFYLLANPNIDLDNLDKNQIKQLMQASISFFDNKFADQISKINDPNSSNNYYTSFHSENPFLYLDSLDSIVQISNENLNDKQFFLDMMIDNKVLV